MKKAIKTISIVLACVFGISLIGSFVEKCFGKQGWAEGHRPKGFYEKYLKRPMDIMLSLIALLLLWPVMLVLALLVRVKHGSPVLFKQERPGLNGHIFTLYKFRTMTDERDENGELLPDGERLTGLGKWLRLTSLDELPELFNILKGDMSIVGPRPLLVKYLPYYTEREKKRHDVRPGLTGLAQVNGRNLLSWDERLEKDVEYVEFLTFFTDVRILLMTIKTIASHSDILVDTGKGEPDFSVERRVKKDL